MAKLGNWAASIRCESVDLLETLGVRLGIEPEHRLRVLRERNFAFLFARKYHCAMCFVGGVRKEIQITTFLYILGLLANPAKASLTSRGQPQIY